MKRAALYSRVSTIEQEKTGYSLKAQREKMEQFANMKDYTIADHYSDLSLIHISEPTRPY